jgi:hypothetical protein
MSLEFLQNFLRVLRQIDVFPQTPSR